MYSLGSKKTKKKESVPDVIYILGMSRFVILECVMYSIMLFFLG